MSFLTRHDKAAPRVVEGMENGKVRVSIRSDLIQLYLIHCNLFFLIKFFFFNILVNFWRGSIGMPKLLKVGLILRE